MGHGEVLDGPVRLHLLDEEGERLAAGRCLPSSTLPSRTSMIGLIDRTDASSALAPPIRPPFFRLSSVSSAPRPSCERRASAPRRRRRRARRRPRRGEQRRRRSCPGRVSRTGVDDGDGTRPSTLRRGSALCIVADSAADSDTTITPVAPADARTGTPPRTPGAGAAVSGSVAEAAQRCQNTSGVRSRRSTNSSSPKRMVAARSRCRVPTRRRPGDRTHCRPRCEWSRCERYWSSAPVRKPPTGCDGSSCAASEWTVLCRRRCVSVTRRSTPCVVGWRRLDRTACPPRRARRALRHAGSTMRSGSVRTRR